MKRALIVLLYLSIIVPTTIAEMLPEQRADASHVVIGTVDRVFQRDAKENKEFIVRLKVEKMEKGDGFAPGDFLHAFCFTRKWSLLPIPAPSGHRAVPKEGERIKAYLHRRTGTFAGNYPDWFDAVPDRP